YAGREVAGKAAEFEVTAKAVEERRLPEVDADFAKLLGVADGDVARMRNEVRANVEREVKKRIDNNVKQKVMQALLDTTRLDVPKSLIEIEVQRLVQQTRAEMESRGLKSDRLPVGIGALEQQARRRVALGLVLGELVKAHGLAARPEQVRALV